MKKVNETVVGADNLKNAAQDETVEFYGITEGMLEKAEELAKESEEAEIDEENA